MLYYLLTSSLVVYDEHVNDLRKLDDTGAGNRLATLLSLVQQAVQLEMTQKFNYLPPDIRGTNVEPLLDDEFESYKMREFGSIEKGWTTLGSRNTSRASSLASQEVPDSDGEFRYSKDSQGNVDYSPEPPRQRRQPAQPSPQRRPDSQDSQPSPQRRQATKPKPRKKDKTGPRQQAVSTPSQEENWDESPAPTPPPPGPKAKANPKPKPKTKPAPLPAVPQTPSRKVQPPSSSTPSVRDFFSPRPSTKIGMPGPSSGPSSRNRNESLEKGKGKGKAKDKSS